MKKKQKKCKVLPLLDDEIEPKIVKIQKNEKTEVFNSLFHKQGEIKTDTSGDFLSRCAKMGLR